MKLEEFLAFDLKQKFGKTRQEAEKESLWNIRDCYEIQDLFRRPCASDSWPGNHLDKPCPECGRSQLYSGSVDIGGIDYYMNHWQICMDCLYAQHREDFFGTCQNWPEGAMDNPFL